MLEMRNRSMPLTPSSASTSWVNVSPVERPKSPMFTPVKTISLPPCAATSSACATIDAIEPLRERPRAMGMVQ